MGIDTPVATKRQGMCMMSPLSKARVEFQQQLQQQHCAVVQLGAAASAATAESGRLRAELEQKRSENAQLQQQVQALDQVKAGDACSLES